MERTNDLSRENEREQNPETWPGHEVCWSVFNSCPWGLKEEAWLVAHANACGVDKPACLFPAASPTWQNLELGGGARVVRSPNPCDPLAHGRWCPVDSGFPESP